MDFSFVSRFRAVHTITWALLLSSLIVGVAASIGRATVNLRGALTADDASLAAMLLVPGIDTATVVRASGEKQEILAETKSGPKLIRMKRGPTKWYVDEIITLREHQ